MKLFTAVLIIFTAVLTDLAAQTTAGEYYQLANEAYESKDYPVFLSHLEQANELRPNHRVILYNLAIAYTLNDQHLEAIKTLEYRASFYALNDFEDDQDFIPLKKMPEYQKLISSIEDKNTPVLSSALHFEFKEPGFHPEGIAVHPITENFLLSDVRCGLIYTFDKNNLTKNPFLDLKEFGFWGAMGMAFDKTDSDILWVTTSVLPNYCEYADSLEGKSAVLKIDIRNKKLIRSYSTEGNHVFGDLITTKSGSVYISDSANPVVYKIDGNENELEAFLVPDNLFNLQGLALGDENTLYLSDYITGVYSVDLTSKEVVSVLSENQLTRGADGLYYSNDQLYLMQNGTRPFQVAKVDLSKSSLKILDRATLELNEPTLGTIHKGVLYFVSNSPWAFYDENNNPNLDEWPALQVRRHYLNK